MNVYIVRHGQTDWNVEGRYGGRIDVPLNDKGLRQANEIKQKLIDIKFDKVYSSPLIRAYKTAQIICDNDIIVDDRIIERNNGELEGKLKTEIVDNIDFNDPYETKYNIESIIDFRCRIKDFLDDILSNNIDSNVLIVTHAGVGIYMRCYFEGEPIDSNYNLYKINNCEVIKYENIDKNKLKHNENFVKKYYK